jgi:hypothetical protein
MAGVRRMVETFLASSLLAVSQRREPGSFTNIQQTRQMSTNVLPD